MNRAILIMIGALMPAVAAAHPSMVPHQHPHAASFLPDLAAVLLAALLVGIGILALRRMRKE